MTSATGRRRAYLPSVVESHCIRVHTVTLSLQILHHNDGIWSHGCLPSRSKSLPLSSSFLAVSVSPVFPTRTIGHRKPWLHKQEPLNLHGFKFSWVHHGRVEKITVFYCAISLSLSVCRFICLSVCLFISLSLSVCLSVCLFPPTLIYA